MTVQDVPVGGLSASNSGPTVLGQATQLNANATGSNITYQWSFGDGAAGTGKALAHVSIHRRAHGHRHGHQQRGS